MPTSFSKDQVHRACRELLTVRLGELQSQIDELKESLRSETKSSAGDKHETGRAMIQLEQERLGSQFSAMLKQLELLDRLPKEPCDRIVLGALARVSGTWYYFSTGIGSVHVEGEPVMAIGLASPLAQAVKGMATGSSVQFRDQLLRVEEVV